MSRRRARIMILTLAMASLVATARATAAEWRVAGVPLLAGETRELTEAAKVVGGKPTLELEIPATTFKLSCSKLAISKGFIEGLNKNPASFYNFEGCAISSPAGCSLTSTTIFTKELTGTTAKAGVEDAMTLEPKFLTGGAEIILEFALTHPCATGNCLAKAVVLGKMVLNMPNGQKENADQRLEVTNANSLSINNLATKYSLNAEIELTSGKLFSFM